MKKYLIVCFVIVQPVLMIGMDNGNNEGGRKLSFPRPIGLSSSQPIPIAKSHEFVDELKQPLKIIALAKSKSFRDETGVLPSLLICEQGCSPSRSDYRTY